MRTLEEWYRRVNGIYFDRNFYRSVESVFCHLVEVGRGLGIAASRNESGSLTQKISYPRPVHGGSLSVEGWVFRA
jgi:hypothetical protein